MAITNFIPTIWSETLLQAMDRKYIGVANCNRSFEGEIREKGSTVKICGLGSILIGDYNRNADMSAPKTLNETVYELAIEQAKYFHFQIDDVDRAQASPQLMETALKGAASSLINVAEQYVYTIAQGTNRVIETDDLSPENVFNTLIDARTMLLATGITDPNDIVVEVAPDIAGCLMKAKLTMSSDNTALMESGVIGNLGGCKIYATSAMPQSFNEASQRQVNCIVRSRRAIAFAEQLSEVEAYRPELRFADAMKGLHLYGAKIVYPQEVIRVKFTVKE